MDSFLSDLGSKGSRDSEGVFTINQAKAQLKLAQFQLASYQEFPRFIVGVANVARLPKVEVRLHKLWTLSGKSNCTTIEFHELLLEKKQLAEIGFGSLAEQNPLIRYLAVLLSTLGKHHGVHVMSGESDPSLSIWVGSDKVEDAEPEPKFFRRGGTTLIVKDTDLRETVARVFLSSRHKCWANLFVEVPNLTVDISVGLQSKEAFPGALAIFIRENDPMIPVAISASKNQMTRREHSGNGPSFVLAYDRYSKLGTWLIVRGLAFPLYITGFPGVCGVIIDDTLRLDLSFQNVVRDDAHGAMLDQIYGSIALMIKQVLTRATALGVQDELNLITILRTLEQKFDVSELFQSLESRSQIIQPTSDVTKLKILEEMVNELSPHRRDKLLTDYEAQIAQFWSAGYLEGALSYCKALRSLQVAVGQETQYYDNLYTLLYRFGRDSDAGDNPDRLLKDFLDKYRSWLYGNVVQFTNLAHAVHPSWFLPVAVELSNGQKSVELLENEKPMWLIAWETLQQGRAAEALALLEAGLGPEEKTALYYWYGHFWEYHKGELDWKSAVRLRVKFSQSILQQDSLPTASDKFLRMLGLHETAKVPEELHVQMYLDQAKQMSENAFWAHFLYLRAFAQRRFGPDVSRKHWINCILCRLINAMFREPDKHPLETDFLAQNSGHDSFELIQGQ